MKKRGARKHSKTKLEKTLGLFSVGSIAMSIFMGYNRITGNVIASGSDYNLLSIGGSFCLLWEFLEYFWFQKNDYSKINFSSGLKFQKFSFPLSEIIFFSLTGLFKIKP